MLSLCVCSLIIWSYFLQLQYPFPFFGHVLGLSTIFILYLTFWYLIPRSWRKNNSFRKRIKSFFIATGASQTLTLEYSILRMILLRFPREFQWILAIFLPFIREFNVWSMVKLATKSSGGDITTATITCIHSVGTQHSFFLALSIGGIATFTTSAVIVATDFLLNIIVCLRIIKARRTLQDDIEKQITLVQELVVTETVELMVPVAYILCFIMAYFGPNGELIGNVRNGYWQYSAVDDVGNSMMSISVFFGLGLCGIVFCNYLLWIFCRINAYEVYLVLQKEFAFVFSIRVA